MRLAYLYSRYPVLSQTFCDTEMLALEQLGFPLLIGSIYSPLTSIRHGHAARFRSPIHYAPPQPIMRLWEEKARTENRWPEALIAKHDRQYGSQAKAALRARNAAYFAELFTRNKIDHLHVHFANRAAHTALFLKAITGLPFSITAHGQDFMADLGSRDLLREICDVAEFVGVETDYSRGLMAHSCPAAVAKIHRVYNGMNLDNFLSAGPSPQASEAIRIVSIGRLVKFKGFEYLIEACARLREHGVNFRCDIIGDGPLHESLQERIDASQLGNLVTLAGALPQEGVMESLRRCDIFALAATIDDRGASDIFPTVILEAMASARPVVSTTIAGIPEAVVNNQTGSLVPPGESGLLADALEALCRNRDLRTRFGAAGRARIESHFQVQTTVQPLIKLFEEHVSAAVPTVEKGRTSSSQKGLAYLIDRWPDDTLPSLEQELGEVRQRNPRMKIFVCEFVNNRRLSAVMKRLALHLEFLPDAMAIEGECQANRPLMLTLEEDRANQSVRAPADLFLRQARFAITLRRMLGDVSHVHATSARALICGVLLRKLLGVTLSASIEKKHGLPQELVVNALQHAVGGRVADRTLTTDLNGRFVLDNSGALGRGLRRLTPAGDEIRLTHRRNFWQEWARLLDQWSSGA